MPALPHLATSTVGKTVAHDGVVRLTAVRLDDPVSLATLIGMGLLVLLLLGILLFLARQLVLLRSRSLKPAGESSAAALAVDVSSRSNFSFSQRPSFTIDDFPIDDEVEKHLKDDEKLVYKILKSREGHCEQGTLLVITKFSKAYLSRLLSEMDTRGIITKEQKGKKNVIRLRV
ncbi:hypothetical protein HYU19_03905 [Candidatus Woesearchaeota archaeon]|nr:hypothetical protein [Candidatus Woesearchaeota archaeon]